MNEITIPLESGTEIPLYEQIYQYMKEHIYSGKIPCHEKLPSARSLAAHLDVSRSTVDLAYEQLISEGYIESVPCKGYYVLEIEELHKYEKRQERHVPALLSCEETYRFDFSPYGVDLRSFPYNTWRKLSKAVLSGEEDAVFSQGDAQGEYGLRDSIASYLYQARGVNCTPNQIIIGAGNDFLLMLLGTLLGREHKIAFENPTYRQAYRLFENLFYPICTADMDRFGMSVDKLRQTGADIAYVMPSHQYPLGIVMPIKRRMELLSWAAEEEGRYIIEDDYDSEYRYKGKPIPALQGTDHCEKVIYLGTFSRSIAPAIRMSYMVLPQPLLYLYLKKSKLINATVSKIDQLVVQKFIDGGFYERHLNKTRALYKGRHDLLLNELKPLLAFCRISGEHAGVHILLHFNGRTEQELIEKAAEAGVKVYGLSRYYTGDKREEETTILLGYANMQEDEIKEAVGILKQIWT